MLKPLQVIVTVLEKKKNSFLSFSSIFQREEVTGFSAWQVKQTGFLPERQNTRIRVECRRHVTIRDEEERYPFEDAG